MPSFVYFEGETLTTQTISNFSTAAGSDFAALTMFSRNTALTTSDVIRKIGAYSTSARTVVVKIGKRNSAGNFDILVSESFSHAGGGWQDFTLSADYTVTAGNDKYVAAYSATPAWSDNATSGISRAYKSGNVTGTAQSGFSEDTIVGMLPLRVVKVT